METPPPAPRLATGFAAGFAALLALAASGPALAQANVVAGSGIVVAADIRHPNGNVYDQVLLTGPSIVVRADPGQVVRCSFLDPGGDIVQCEFAGPGRLGLDLDAATYQPPAPPARYHQPGVAYVTGRATVTIDDATADTHVSIFSVGTATALNPSLFPPGQAYDGLADVQLLRVNGPAIGSILVGNTRFSGRAGDTGILAPGTAVRDRAVLHDIEAAGAARPVLQLSRRSTLTLDQGCVLLAGGDLAQPNGSAVDITADLVDTLPPLVTVANLRSDGTPLPRLVVSAATAFQGRGPGALFVDGMPFVPSCATLERFFPGRLDRPLVANRAKRISPFASLIPLPPPGIPLWISEVRLIGAPWSRYRDFWIIDEEHNLQWEVVFFDGRILEIIILYRTATIATWS